MDVAFFARILPMWFEGCETRRAATAGRSYQASFSSWKTSSESNTLP